MELSYSEVTEDGVFLISASKDGKPMLRNGETGDWIGTFEGHKGAVWSACVNRPATHAATASADFTARVWDAISGDEVFNFAHKHIVRTVAFSQARGPRGGRRLPAPSRLTPVQDSKRLLTGGHEKLLRIFDLMAPDCAPSVLEGSPGPVRAARWLSDALLLVACNDAAGVRVWDLRTRGVALVLDTGADAVQDVALSGPLLVAAAGKSVRTWDAATFAPVATHALDFPVYSADCAVGRGRFVAAGADMWPRLYDLATGAELECNKGHHGPVHSVRFHRARRRGVGGRMDGWRAVQAARLTDAPVRPAPPCVRSERRELRVGQRGRHHQAVVEHNSGGGWRPAVMAGGAAEGGRGVTRVATGSARDAPLTASSR